jgi:predicted TIM-barrel fold metal-dependent hydrolase
MIDCHLHVARPNLPGVGPLAPLLDRGAAAVAEALRLEMAEAGVEVALAMGSWQAGGDDPLGVKATLEVAKLVPGLHAVGVADPTRSDRDHLKRVEAALAAGPVKALKAYLGYLHYPPDHPGYRPYYELAERHRLPVIFHTGDAYSPYAKVRLAHPLLVDDVAVDHPNARFVLGHLGYPWLTDAAEVVYKNLNVWADLSGLVIGAAEVFDAEERREALQEVRDGVRRALRYAERPTRFLFGSDWPLAPLAAYRDFVASAVPEGLRELVFEENARMLFRV